MSPLGALVLCALGGYAIGSIPWAVITGFALGRGDIRRKGSGNAGATNVLRVLGKGPALFVLVMDLLKAAVPVFLAPSAAAWLAPEYNHLSPGGLPMGPAVLTAVILGHAFPLWAGFRGGKGMACAAGGVAVLYPLGVPFCLLLFTAAAKITGYASSASLLTAWGLPLIYWLTAKAGLSPFSKSLFIFFLSAAGLVTFLHRSNIRRLIRGEERKIRAKGELRANRENAAREGRDQ